MAKIQIEPYVFKLWSRPTQVTIVISNDWIKITLCMHYTFKMVICYKTMYILHMTWRSFVQLCCVKCERVCTKFKRECVQKRSAPADECVAKHFLCGRENQRGNGYNWRTSLVMDAYHVRNSCSMNLVSKSGFILSLLTTEGRKSYDFSPNFTYHRPCMITLIVCKNKRVKLSDIVKNDSFGYYCSHAFSTTHACVV